MLNRTWLWLLLIFGVAVAVRSYFLYTGTLLFTFDQARDAFIVDEILQGDLKILGPPTSGVQGLYHGVLYYYFLLPGYQMGRGNPVVAAYIQSLVNAMTIVVIFILTKLLTRKIFPALLSCLLFAVSFEAVQYSTWLSNPAMGVWFVPLIYLGMAFWMVKKKTWGLLLAGLAFGLAMQSNISLAYHLLPIVFLFLTSRLRVGLKGTGAFSLGVLAGVSTIVLAEIKFGFKSIGGILAILGVTGTGNQLGFGDAILKYFNKMGNTFAYNLFPQMPALGGLLGVLLIVWAAKNIDLPKIVILVWVLAYLPPAMLGGLNVPHITVGIGVAVIVLYAMFISSLWSKNKFAAIILCLLCIGFNLQKNHLTAPYGQTIFAIQSGMLLSDQLALLDYTYQSAAGEPFSISTLTSPLYINTTWSYLYNWYGKSQYGYLPSWVGPDQVGIWGDNLPKEEPPLHYFIIEDTTGIPSQYRTYAIGEQDVNFGFVEQEQIGALLVQRRQKIN